MPLPKGKVALVTGANGISGYAIVEYLCKQPESEWSLIVATSRRPSTMYWVDPRVVFVTADFLDPVETIAEQLGPSCKDVTHAFFTSYVHSAGFKQLRDKNVPLFKNFLDTVDSICPRLERVILQTGGKHYGVHLGPVTTPSVEDKPRYKDEFNFYFAQEDHMFALQAKRGTWNWNVIRPNGIIGFTPHGSGMSEALTLAMYFLLCRELNEPARFFGNEYMWNTLDDKSSSAGLAEISVWSATQEHTKDEAFNYVNGDVFTWKNLWPALAAYYGADCPPPEWTNAAGQFNSLTTEFNVVEWANDKKPVWQKIVSNYGGKLEAWDWTTWDSEMWAFGRSWQTVSSMTKARKFGWTHLEDTQENYFSTIRSLENAGILPRMRGRQ
ncbi:SDR family oxidoreductase [Aspergillus puulaauensis]|uniref:PRISE-like Rossmann-fold domain-containing protein n=1 Tax=Aspergillus puulaauensis TaxID=1220207 RepID=A0A7R7XZQ2_9EURO|nr:uncharacterized protein APUU_80984S [Aspergillus puulaauensis]BCS30681.1 hypothetical protein APUU_80984S [Aspergillus puulaauensis]